MIAKIARLILLLAVAISAEESENKEFELEARGKGKYALLIHFFYVVATKVFVLKIIYGAIFYALICKGWHFFSWFIQNLKEKKHYGHKHYGHHHYGHDHYGHDHYGHDHYGHDHYGHDHYGNDNYGYNSYGGYAYDKHGSGGDTGLKTYDKNIMYDSDGSYSVKS